MSCVLHRLFSRSSLAVLVLMASTSLATAAELKLMAPIAMRAVIDDIVAGYEKSSGNKVAVRLSSVGSITDRVQKGEEADVVIVGDQQNDDLQKQGKIAAGSKVAMARVGYGLFVKKGARKPDISTVDALKKTLLAATSITYNDPKGGAPTGAYSTGLLERLGIASELQPRTKFMGSAEGLKAVANGEIELRVGVVSDISSPEAAGVELAGVFPEQVQSYSSVAVGILAASKQADAAKTLVAALTSMEAKAMLKAKGFEPR